VSLQPLPVGTYGFEDQIRDLVERMIVAKVYSAEAVFLSKPFDDRSGAMKSDGTPTELFLPWRMTASMISGRTFLGSVVLPNRSRNYNFSAGGNKAVMVVWNDKATADKPVVESLYLGEDPEIVDLWGKRIPVVHDGHSQMIPVGRMPIFVTGLNGGVVKLRRELRLVQTNIPSFPNRKFPFPIRLKNSTAHPLAAQISVVPPNPGDWRVAPPVQPLSLSVGAEAQTAFDLTLTNQANTGVQPFRFDVKTTGAEELNFSVYADLMVGDPELSMEFSTRINRSGDLEVYQVFINNSETAKTYRCRLYVKGYGYRSATIAKQGYGRVESLYTLTRGHELHDKGVREATLFAIPVGSGQPMVYTVRLFDQ